MHGLANVLFNEMFVMVMGEMTLLVDRCAGQHASLSTG